MKPTASFSFRLVLAVAVLLAVLAIAYRLAGRLPTSPQAGPSGTRPHRLRPDTLRLLSARDLAAAATASPPATAERTPCPSQPIRFVAPDPAQPPLQLRRYVGTVGGQPATALLQWRTLDEVSGHFYYHRGGPDYRLSSEQPAKRLTLGVKNSQNEELSAWHLAGRPGAVLRGTWHNATGNHLFYLRENYTGGVRIDVRTVHLTGGQAFHEEANEYESPCSFGSYEYDYFRLPVPVAVAPAVRQALAPPLASVHRRLRALFDGARSQRQTLTRFLLNDSNLLSYQVERTDYFVLDGGKGDYWDETYLVDLLTGRELAPASQLRPSCERPLNRLFLQHMLHDPKFDFINKDHQSTWAWQDSTYEATGQLALSKDGRIEGLFLTGSGLGTVFSSYLTEGQIGPYRDNEVIISYRELRPLVRPGTPLARLLRARGL